MEISEKRIGKDNILLGFFFFFVVRGFVFMMKIYYMRGMVSALLYKV